MAKESTNYPKDFQKAVEVMAESAKKYKKVLDEIEGKKKTLEADRKRELESLKYYTHLTDGERKKQIDSVNKKTEEDKKNLDLDLANKKTDYENKKKFYTDLYTAQIEANKKQAAEDQLKIGKSKSAGEEELQDRVETNNQIIEEQKRFGEEIKKLDEEIDPEGTKKTTNKEAKDKKNEEWKKKYGEVATKTQEYTQVGADALGKMFTGMTKYMDEAIAKRKKEVEAITKQISQIDKRPCIRAEEGRQVPQLTD